MARENNLFALLDEEGTDRGTHRACVVAVTRANKQFGSFFKQAASEDDYMARLGLVVDKINDIVREACVEQGSTNLEFVAQVLASELARTSEVMRDTVQDEDVAPSDGEDGIMHVRGEAGRTLLGLPSQLEENGGKKEAAAPFGRDDMWPEYPAYSENEQDRGVDEADSLRADDMRANGICPYCMEKHDENDHFPEDEGDHPPYDDAWEARFEDANGYHGSKTAAPRRRPTPRFDEGTGRMYQPTKHTPRKRKGPADPNAPDVNDPMKNKNVVRTPGQADPLGAPVDQTQVDYDRKNRNAVPLDPATPATNKSLRELEGLAPLRPGQLQSDDEAAFLRAMGSKTAVETGDTYTQETVDLPSAKPEGSMEPSPKMDKGNAGDENHTSQKPIDVPSVANPSEHQEIDDRADYTKALEVPGVVDSVNADTPIQPEHNVAPNTDTWSGNKDQANPVTSKWKIIG